MSDPVLDLVAQDESGNRNVPNYKYGPGFTAGGYYQITDTNWRHYAPRLGIATPNAMASSHEDQTRVASLMKQEQGLKPWVPYNPRLRRDLGMSGGGDHGLPPEGYYGGAQHINITPLPRPDPLDQVLALAGGMAFGPPQPAKQEADPNADALAFLKSFVEPPGGAQGAGSAAGGTTGQPIVAAPTPAPSAPATAPTPIPSIAAQTTIEPPAAGQAEPPMPGPEPMAPIAGQEGQPQPPFNPLGPKAPNEADPITGILEMAKDVGEAALGTAQLTAQGFNRLAGLGRLNAPGHAPIAPGLSRIGDVAMAGSMPGLSTETRAAAQAAQAAPNVARNIAHSPELHLMQQIASDEGGAIPLPPALRQGLVDASQGIQRVFSPSTVDQPARRGEALIRSEVGAARRSTAQAEAQVSRRGPLANPPAADMIEAMREPWRPLVNRHVPNFRAYVAAKQAGQNPPKPGLLRFLDFVEGRTAGVTYQGPPELRELADVLRRIYEERRLAVAAEPSTSWAGAIEDYFSHQWADPRAAARAFLSTGRQGSGRSLRQRSIPTISEGIDRGLVPATFDPIEATMSYVHNMDRYLAHNRIFRIGRDEDLIKFYRHGEQPDGWEPLTGRLAERAVATGGIPEALGMTAYAPEGFARVYNNSVSTGFLAGRLGGPFYTALLHAKNGITQSVLSLSAFHAMAMSQEASASAFATGIEGLKQGEISAALKQLGLGSIPGLKATYDLAKTGRRLERQYLGIQDYGPDLERVANLYAGAGGRVAGRGAEYRTSAMNNYFTAFRRGATRMELADSARRIGQGNVLTAPVRMASFLGREIGRINETITAPLFDKVIPQLKFAAFGDEMQLWLKGNPLASAEEQLAQARRISDTIDDRFGEMVMDNIFWGQRAKQSLQLAATSLGWELGSVRSLGGAPFDVLRGNIQSPRIRYLIGLSGAISLENAAYQYLATGKAPGQGIGGLMSPGGAVDLMTPRTGGTTPEGARERALLPGFEKDVIGFFHDPLGEFAGKLAPGAQLAVQGLTGRDYFGHQIAPFPKYTPEWFRSYANHVFGSLAPIPFAQDILKGSHIGRPQRLLGIRPAPPRWEDPQREQQMEAKRNIKDLQGQLRGLYAHGVRTTEERRTLDAKAKAIIKQIEDASRRLRPGRPAIEYRGSP